MPRRRMMMDTRDKTVQMGDEKYVASRNQDWYLDSGSEAYEGGMSTRGMIYQKTSVSKFDEDTIVTIDLEGTGQVYSFFTFSSSDDNQNFYVENTDDAGWQYPFKGVHATYKVRAGNYFRISSYASSFDSFDMRIEIAPVSQSVSQA